MSISAYLLQKAIPPQVAKPGHPFDNFGWPAILYGALQEYKYPEHLGPFSVNFCFSGVLSIQSKGREHLADSSSFCISNRNYPTTVRTLTARKSSQLAFFYAHKFIARLLSPTGIFIEDGKETDYQALCVTLSRNPSRVCSSKSEDMVTSSKKPPLKVFQRLRVNMAAQSSKSDWYVHAAVSFHDE
jgi:hypothetical protein